MLASVCSSIASDKIDSRNKALNIGDTLRTIRDIKQSCEIAHVGVELSDGILGYVTS